MPGSGIEGSENISLHFGELSRTAIRGVIRRQLPFTEGLWSVAAAAVAVV
jgi:hypothetical protein